MYSLINSCTLHRSIIQFIVCFLIHWGISSKKLTSSDSMQTTETEHCHKHIDSIQLQFSEHHQQQTREDVNANVFVTLKYDPLFHSTHNARDRTVKVIIVIITYFYRRPLYDATRRVIQEVTYRKV